VGVDESALDKGGRDDGSSIRIRRCEVFDNDGCADNDRDSDVKGGEGVGEGCRRGGMDVLEDGGILSR
jgi:hypothetical protein